MKKKLFAFALAGALGLGCLSGCGGAHILAAEDNNLDMEILHFFLEDLNCVVTEARDGQQAVDRMDQRIKPPPKTFSASR